jgi:ParB family chromosome partitioning protein
VLSSSRDIPFSQLVLSQKNVRRVKAGLSIEDLADDIYRRTLLQSLNVRAMLDDDGKETGSSRFRPAAAASARSNCW